MAKVHLFSEVEKKRAVNRYDEIRGNYKTEWQAMIIVAKEYGCTPETIRAWARKYEPAKDNKEEKPVNNVKVNENEVRAKRIEVDALEYFKATDERLKAFEEKLNERKAPMIVEDSKDKTIADLQKQCAELRRHNKDLKRQIHVIRLTMGYYAREYLEPSDTD